MSGVAKVEVPRPQADKTGRHSRTGPLTLHLIRMEKEIQRLRSEDARLREDNAALRRQVTEREGHK